MVAASGSTEGLSLKIAIPALAAIFVGLGLSAFLLPKLQVASYVPLDYPPEVLNVKVRDIVRSLGYTDPPADTQAGFYYNEGPVRDLKAPNPGAWRKVLEPYPSPILYAYRQSPASLLSQRYSDFGRVNGDDPPPYISGMIQISVDPSGRLMALDAVPPQFEKGAGFPAPDWAPLFAAAHFDLAKFTSAEPQWAPLAATDVRAAWTGNYPGNVELHGATPIPIRVEAAAFHGRPVHFEIVWPSTRPLRVASPNQLTPGRQASNIAAALLQVGILLIAGWLARYNWKAGRGDLRGATTLGVYMASVFMLKWILSAHHVSSAGEQSLFGAAISEASYTGVRYWIFYLALEPWVRRYWPQNLVTWARLLAGRWRDPLVGRDALFGILMGVGYSLMFQGYVFALMFNGGSPDNSFGASNLNSVRFLGYTLSQHLDSAVGGALYFFMILFVLRAVLRKQWLAGAAFVLIFVAMRWAGQGVWFTPLFLLAVWSTLTLAILRFGLFATICLVFVIDTPLEMIFTTDYSAWYGQSSWVMIAILAGAAIWAFRTSLGGRALFRSPRSSPLLLLFARLEKHAGLFPRSRHHPEERRQ